MTCDFLFFQEDFSRIETINKCTQFTTKMISACDQNRNRTAIIDGQTLTH